MTNPFLDPQIMDQTPHRLSTPNDAEAVQVRDHLSIIQDAQMHIHHYLSVIEDLVKQSPQDPDVQAAGAKAAVDLTQMASEIKDTARTYLWNRYGAGTHATPDGVKFSLSKPASSRRVDYKRLEFYFPEAYEAVVKTTLPGADTIGRLTIK